MPKQPQPAPFEGALVIDKPKGKTSHDVVDAVRHLAGFRQIGHLGTLDPLATGVLVLLLGRARGWCSSTPDAASDMRRAFGSVSRRIHTIPMAKRRGRTPRRRWMPRPSKSLPLSALGGSNRCRRRFPRRR